MINDPTDEQIEEMIASPIFQHFFAPIFGPEFTRPTGESEMTTSREVTEKHEDDAARAAAPTPLTLPSAELLDTTLDEILATVSQLHRMDASLRAHLPLSDYAQLSSIRTVLASAAGRLKAASKTVEKIERKEAKIDHRKGNV